MTPKFHHKKSPPSPTRVNPSLTRGGSITISVRRSVRPSVFTRLGPFNSAALTDQLVESAFTVFPFYLFFFCCKHANLRFHSHLWIDFGDGHLRLEVHKSTCRNFAKSATFIDHGSAWPASLCPPGFPLCSHPAVCPPTLQACGDFVLGDEDDGRKRGTFAIGAKCI